MSRTAPTPGRVVQFLEEVEAEKAGHSSIPTPYRQLNHLIGGGLRRGYSSVLAGPPGNGKSYLAYRLMIFAIEHGFTCAYIPLEYRALDHIRRCMGVVLGSWGMIADTPDKAEARMDVITKNPDMLQKWEQIEACVLENPGDVIVGADGVPYVPNVPYRDVQDLVHHYCMERDLVIVDPITAIDHEQGRGAAYEQQEAFIKRVKAITGHSKSHCLLVGHTRRRTAQNGKYGPLGNDDVAGSLALSRFAQYMLLLDYHDTRESWAEKGPAMGQSVEHSRTLFIGKSTFGGGTGQKLAFDFGTGPSMDELGWVKKND